MMTANVLAKETDVSLHTIRHYTRIGLLHPSRNPSNNYKVYQASIEGATLSTHQAS